MNKNKYIYDHDQLKFKCYLVIMSCTTYDHFSSAKNYLILLDKIIGDVKVFEDLMGRLDKRQTHLDCIIPNHLKGKLKL